MAYELYYKTLWTLSSSGLTTSFSGVGTTSSQFVSLQQVSDVLVMGTVTGTSSGTSPTLDVFLDGQDPDGNVYLGLLHLSQITAGPGQVYASAGLHIASPGSMVLPAYGRLRWTLGGTAPAFPGVSLTLAGR